MAREGVSFDQARLIRHKLLLSRHGIDATGESDRTRWKNPADNAIGMPTDPKAITRL
ncbi:hypothetical protein CALVIDRAFT_532318 [Calocera viscosa TUFC12733]|uniref:Uncharacterized protein n=1 Tax=Calocera viscosa (strain TUFC12733) TaxID=1330018 RepID=A0A167S3I9_CALVF|nr:hypothetical protein CALVIDRAFT_532318 [Calocera viscosa TUFC12733]